MIRTAISVSSPAGVALAGQELDLLQPGAGRGRQDALDQRVELVAGQLGGRPDVHHDPVGVEALVLRALRLDVADRVQARGDRVLHRGQRDQPAVGLAQRRQVADLAHRDQPLVGRVALGDRLEQVDLLVGGRQPGEVELAQPLQLQALGDLRVQAADQPVLGEAPAPSGRKVKWWCITAPLVPATVVVIRRTPAGSGCAARSSPSRTAIASASGWSSQVT